MILVFCARGPLSQESPLWAVLVGVSIPYTFKMLWLWAINKLYLSNCALNAACHPPHSSTHSIYPKNTIERVTKVVKVHGQPHFLMYFQHVYFADTCPVLCLLSPSPGHALRLPLHGKAGAGKGWEGESRCLGRGWRALDCSGTTFSLSSGFPGVNIVPYLLDQAASLHF